MKKDINDIDDLIGKYLAGEAGPDESRIVESWVSQKPENKKYFDQVKVIFDRASSITDVQRFDTDAAWNKMRSKITQRHETKIIQLPEKKSQVGLYLRVAASLAIAVGIGLIAYRWLNPATTSTMRVATELKTQADTLPDGTNVFLNRKTELAYEFDKRKEKHMVKLRGEAYFKIQSENDKKFIVQTEEIFIEDIGTSFNVTAYPEQNTIEVVVDEGEVIFYSDVNPGVHVRANEKGVFNKTTRSFTLTKPEPNTTAYKTKFFSFSDNDLQTVINELNEVYPQKIRINESIQDCRLTVTFKNEEPKEIANVIAETLGLTVKVSGHEILLEGSGCGQ